MVGSSTLFMQDILAQDKIDLYLTHTEIDHVNVHQLACILALLFRWVQILGYILSFTKLHMWIPAGLILWLILGQSENNT